MLPLLYFYKLKLNFAMKKLLLATCLFVFTLSLNAQVGLYSFRAFSASFDTIVGGTDDNAVEDDDEVGNIVPIGFSFNYDGTNYTHVVASSNGWLSFDTSNTNSDLTNDLDFSSTAIRPLLAPLWDDLDGSATTGGPSKASYNTSGSSPNRIFTYEWQRWEWNYTSSNAVISFQVKLYETSNKIEFRYRQEGSSPTNPSASIGLAGATTGAGNFLSLDGTGTNPGTSSTVETANLSSLPATGQVYEFSPPANRDAGVSDLMGSVCAGNNDVIVALKNFGLDTLTSASIGWTVSTNGGTPASQTNASWSGTLLLGDTAHVNLGSFNFSASNSYDIVVYSFNPNGQNDEKYLNDTLSLTNFMTGLSGTYTIGGSSPDYTTFTAAVNDLESRGVCSAVTFNVRYRAYNEQISIGAIRGVSATNVVTFTSDPNNSGQPELYFTPAANLYVVEFDGASYVTFDDIFIESLNSASGRVISFTGTNDHITLQNCRIKSPGSSTTSTNSAVIYDFSGTDNKSSNITIQDNSIEGGSYGIYFYGVGTTDFQDGLVISGNDIEDFYYMGVYTYYNSHVEVTDNYVEDIGTYTSPYGIRLGYSDTSEVSANQVVLNATSSPVGLYVYYCDGSNADPVMVYNNLVSIASSSITGSPTGMYAYRGESNEFYYNTAVLYSGSTSSESMYMEYSSGSIKAMNNSLVNYGDGYANYVSNTAGVDTMDHNNYFSNGTNLAYWSGARTSLTALRGISGMETNAVNVDPNYSSPYNLRSYSVGLNGEATPISTVTIDIDGQTRNTTTPDIGADEYTPPAVDIAVTSVLTDDITACGQTAQTLRAIIQNSGTANQSNIPVNLVISGAISQNLNTTYSSTLNSGASDTVSFGTFNTAAGGNFDFSVYSSLSGDTVGFNDTLETATIAVSAIPSEPTAANATLCSGDDAVLVAQSNMGIFEWYDQPAGGTLLASNDSLSLTNMTQSDTFYVEAYDMTITSMGPASNSIGSGANYTSMGQGLVFDVYNSVTLDSVTVYPNSTGNVVINLVNSSGSTLQSRTRAVTSTGAQRLQVGITISPGTDYELTATGTTTGGMYRNSAGAVYPYTDAGNNVRIHETNNSLGASGYYYFFYDWAITVEGCHSERKEVIATVNPAPTVNLGADTGFCQGQNFSITLDATNANSSYFWHDNTTSPTKTISSTGQFWVEVTNNFSCVASDTINVGSFPRPQASNPSFPDFCESLAPFNLTQGTGTPSGGFGYYIGPGTLGDSLYSPAAAGAGTHSVGYVYSSGIGCSDTATTSLTVLAKPTASFSALTNLCANASAITLTQGSGIPAGGSGQYFGPGVSGGNFNPASTGTGSFDLGYVYTGTNGCIDTAMQSIDVDTLPVVSMGTIPSICENESPRTLTQGTPLGGNYTGNGVSNNQIDPSIPGVGLTQITYNFTDGNGCSGTAQGSIRVDAKPNPQLGPDTVICAGQSLTIGPGFGFITYRWDDGSTQRDKIVSSAGTYTISVTNASGCTGVDSINVEVTTCSGIEEDIVSKVKLYPNPTNAELNIHVPSEMIGMDMRLLDALGRELELYEDAALVNRISMHDLATGVYFIEFSDDQRQARFRIIKE